MQGLFSCCCKLALASWVAPALLLFAVLIEKPSIVTLDTSPAADGPASATVESSTMGSAAVFNAIAFAYDSVNKLMSFGLDWHWRQALIDNCLDLQRDDEVLDLATGTADVAVLASLRLRELGGASGRVLGVDTSAEMLRRGAAKILRHDVGDVVRLSLGDAENLTHAYGIDAGTGTPGMSIESLHSESFDKVAVAFGLRSVVDPARALREMWRVLRKRPSSRACILELSLPAKDGGRLSKLLRDVVVHIVHYMDKVVSLVGGLEDEWLARSVLNFPEPLELGASMAREGLLVQSIMRFGFGSVHLYVATPASGA